MLALRSNLISETVVRHLIANCARRAASVDKLSSGQRIVSAKDDPAGLAVRESIRADLAALRQGRRNAIDAVSMLHRRMGGGSD